MPPSLPMPSAHDAADGRLHHGNDDDECNNIAAVLTKVNTHRLDIISRRMLGNGGIESSTFESSSSSSFRASLSAIAITRLVVSPRSAASPDGGDGGGGGDATHSSCQTVHHANMTFGGMGCSGGKEQGKTHRPLARAPRQMHSEWETTTAMNSCSFKRWEILKNGQEFVYSSCRYLKPRDEGQLLKQIAMKKRNNDKWRAVTTGTTAEKEESETMTPKS